MHSQKDVSCISQRPVYLQWTKSLSLFLKSFIYWTWPNLNKNIWVYSYEFFYYSLRTFFINARNTSTNASGCVWQLYRESHFHIWANVALPWWRGSNCGERGACLLYFVKQSMLSSSVLLLYVYKNTALIMWSNYCCILLLIETEVYLYLYD